MNSREVRNQLEKAYPNANIVVTTRRGKRVTEMVAELGISPDGQSSTAIAVIDRANEHFHKLTTEKYIIERGSLKLHVDGDIQELKEGEEATIRPNHRHFARGNATWVKVISTPPWSPDDFYE